MRGVTVGSVLAGAVLAGMSSLSIAASNSSLDQQLSAVLQKEKFTGTLEQDTLSKLGRPLNPKLVELGRNLFFDRILSLSNDNSCSGCHAPQFAFADSQSIAIGVDNNCVVGPGRTGPHNQRRSPSVINAAAYPVMMWNGRFSSISGDPFNNSLGFLFPLPEGDTKFAPHDLNVTSLMAAQGHMPSTEHPEMAGFPADGFLVQLSRFGGDFALIENRQVRRVSGISVQDAKTRNLEILHSPKLAQFKAVSQKKNVACGSTPEKLPLPNAPLTSFSEPIRKAVLTRLQGNAAYAKAFSEVYPGSGVKEPANFSRVGAALAEFQISLLFADAPIDKFARGKTDAMTDEQKRGALLFFGKAKCSGCHAASGSGDELFSDFRMHNIGVPPLYPSADEGNVVFQGLNKDLDLGRAEFTDLASEDDRYLFRTTPLRNVGLQPTFMHNGAYTRLRDAITHHLDAKQALLNYDPVKAGVGGNLNKVANRHPIAATISPRLAAPVSLSPGEVDDLVAFVGDGLTDDRAKPSSACKLIPASLPSTAPLHKFEGC